MTRIDFYVLSASDNDARLAFTCRLVDKAYRQGLRVFIATDNREQTEQLNQLLWNAQPESFTPHDILPTEPEAVVATPDEPPSEQLASPVTIGYGQHCGNHHQLLINLSQQAPDYFSRFERLSEIVIQEPQILDNTRERFKFYRDRGYPIQSHSIN